MAGTFTRIVRSCRPGAAEARCTLLAGAALMAGPAAADAPCGGGEVDECRAYIEINATDGDIGFHALTDAEGWIRAQIFDPVGRLLFKQQARTYLRIQTLTENFFESEEPPCWWQPDNDDVDWRARDAVTLDRFLRRFPRGLYEFRHTLPRGGEISGWTELTHSLPAAPANIDFDGSTVTWEAGQDLGRCEPEGGSGAADVPIVAYRVVFEPDIDAEVPDAELAASQIFNVLVPGNVFAMTLPGTYLDSLPENTPAKAEIIAIEERPNGSFGNQVAGEQDGFCVNATDAGCTDDEDEDEDEEDGGED